MKKTIIINFFVTVIISILLFILQKVFVISLGKELLGLWKLFFSFMGFVKLLDFGIFTVSTQSLYKPFANKNQKEINITISTLNDIYRKVFFAILISGFLFSLLIPFIVTDFKKDYLIYWYLLVVSEAIFYFAIKYKSYFIANGEYLYVIISEGVVKIAILLMQIFVLFYFKSVILFLILYLFQVLLLYLIYFKHFKRYYIYFKTSLKEKTIVKNLKNMFWHKIGTVAVFSTDNILLAKFISLAIVAVYTTYLLIYQAVITFVNVLTNVFSVKIGIFIAKSAKNEIYFLWREFVVFYLFLSLFFCWVLFLFINDFIRLWMGEEFILPKLTVILILLNLFLHINRIIIDVFKNNLAIYEDIYNPLFEAALNFFVSLALVKPFGINGVLIGTVLSNLVVVYYFKPLILYKKGFEKEKKEFFLDLFKWFFAVLVISGELYLFLSLIKPQEIYSWEGFIKNVIIYSLIILLVLGVNFGAIKDFQEFIKWVKYEN